MLRMSNPAPTNKPVWLGEVADLIPEIERVANSCAEIYRVSCFEVLFRQAVELTTWHSGYGGTLAAGAGREAASATGHTQAPNQRFTHFLSAHKLTPQQVSKVLDLGTGLVIARDLGGTVAERQRKLAALIGLWNGSKSGAFEIPYDELIRQCKEFAAYDTANMSSNLRSAEEGGTKVFIKDGNNWKVTIPGEAYVAKVVQELGSLMG